MSSRILLLSLAALSILLFGVLSFDLLNFAIDDVFISMRYAQNAVQGHGLVYNLGQQVEGYSDWLWVLLLMAPMKLGLIPAQSSFALLWWAKGLSYFFGISTIVLLYFLAKRLFTGVHEKFYSWIAVLALCTCAPFISWCMGGLEMTLCSFFLVLSIFLSSFLTSSSKPTILFVLFGILHGAMALTRPEMPLYTAAALVYFWVTRPTDRSRVLLSLGSFLAVLIPFLLWRWNMYHDVVPNTFYAKTGGSLKIVVLGIKYTFAAFAVITGPLLLFLPLSLLKKRDTTQKIASPISGLSWTYIAAAAFFSLYAGGDWMGGFRFFVPTAPLLLLLAVTGLKHLIESSTIQNVLGTVANRPVLGFTFLVIFAVSSAFASRTLVRDQTANLDSGFSNRSGHALPDHLRVAAWIKEHYPTKAVVATNEAGMIGYLNPQMQLIDLWGLMDRYLAKRRKKNLPFDAKYVLDQKPDVILLTGAWTNRYTPEVMPYYPEFYQQPSFRNRYKLVSVIGEFYVYQLVNSSSPL